jgi:hypothetical protein
MQPAERCLASHSGKVSPVEDIMTFRRRSIVRLFVVVSCFLGLAALSHEGPSPIPVSHVVLADSTAALRLAAGIQNRDDRDKKDKADDRKDDKKKEPRYIDKKPKDDDRKDDKDDRKKEDRRPNDR